ncbi:MAG: head-tail connector protein [Alphaproteobacteria bacterium]
MTLRVVTPPTAEPLTLAEVKLNLRVDHADEDALIQGFIAAARRRAEWLTDRHLMPTQLEQVLDAFPASHLALDTAPVTAVEWVRYLDSTGTQQTVPNTAYVLDDAREPSWLLLASGGAWPAATGSNSVRVRFWSGYAAPGATDAAAQAAVPADIKAWMHLAIGTLYRQRETYITGTAVEIPGGFHARLLDEHRLKITV